MIDIAVDFETYYDTEYSLSKLTTIEYVLDPRFQIIGVSLASREFGTMWITGTHQEIKAKLRDYDWSTTRVIAHNAMFDGAILEWQMGIKPAAYLCTMMGARPHVYPHTGSVSLAKVVKYLGVGEKGNEVQNHRGRRREAFSKEQLESYGAYCCSDADLTLAASVHICNWLPQDEQYLISLTLLKFLRPKFLLDKSAIVDGRRLVEESREELLATLNVMGVTVEDVRSRPKFAATLKRYGIEPPKKISKTTDRETLAFAKDDDEFVSLLTNDDVAVRTLVEARLTFASTIEESRFDRFENVYNANLFGNHTFPIALMYYAAHPGRFGGTEKLNQQNLPRPDKDNPRKGALRRTMRAPAGHTVLTADFSNIEARMVATLAGQWDLVAAFAAGRDIYSEFASKIYRRTITKADKVERFVGKMCILGLGYGMGPKRFHHVMSLNKVKMDEQEAQRIVRLYRDTYAAIPEYWTSIQRAMLSATNPKTMVKFGPVTIAHERIILPNGMPILYPGLRIDKEDIRGGLIFDNKRKDVAGKIGRLWGGVLTENVSQALARIVATRSEIRLSKGGLLCAHQAHDELIWVVREDWVPKLKPLIEKVMCDPVEWLPRLPIAVEINHGPTYGDAK